LARRRKPFFLIACADADRAQAHAACAAAREWSFWLDDEADRRVWDGQAVAAIAACKGLLLFCSEAAFAAPDLARETSLAARFHKPILPLVIEAACTPKDYLRFLHRCNLSISMRQTGARRCAKCWGGSSRVCAWPAARRSWCAPTDAVPRRGRRGKTAP
jgi:hypothetical protein